MKAEWRLPHLVGERFEITDPTPDGIEFIADNLREADQQEALAQTGTRRHHATLRASVMSSSSAVMVVSVYGVPMAVGGVNTVSLLSNTGTPWMVGTDELYRHRRALVEVGQAYIQAMLLQYDRLENHVDARNAKSVAWLQRLGFQIEAATPYGPFGLPFHRFWIERKDHV